MHRGEEPRILGQCAPVICQRSRTCLVGIAARHRYAVDDHLKRLADVRPGSLSSSGIRLGQRMSASRWIGLEKSINVNAMSQYDSEEPIPEAVIHEMARLIIAATIAVQQKHYGVHTPISAPRAISGMGYAAAILVEGDPKLDTQEKISDAISRISAEMHRAALALRAQSTSQGLHVLDWIGTKPPKTN